MVESMPAEKQELFECMRAWGYQFAYRQHPESPGFTRLMIAIRETPTRMHFDPETLRIHAPMDDGSISWMTFYYQERVIPERPIGYSRIIVKDRRDKAIAFYSFGGTIRSLFRPGENIYILQSDAPLLDLSSEKDVLSNELADEADILFAQLRARSGGQDHRFYQQVYALKPLDRYAGTILSILGKLEGESALREEREPLRWLLQREARFLATMLPAAKPLEDMLQL